MRDAKSPVPPRAVEVEEDPMSSVALALKLADWRGLSARCE